MIIIIILPCYNRISQPILIGKLLEYFNPDNSENSDIRHAYICAFGLLISLLITTIVNFLTQQDLMDEALKARVASSSLIYKKVNLKNIL